MTVGTGEKIRSDLLRRTLETTVKTEELVQESRT